MNGLKTNQKWKVFALIIVLPRVPISVGLYSTFILNLRGSPLFSFFNGKRWEKQNTENLQNICITNFLIVNLFSSLFDFDTSIYEDNLTCMNDIGQNCQVIFVIVNKHGGHNPEI